MKILTRVHTPLSAAMIHEPLISTFIDVCNLIHLFYYCEYEVHNVPFAYRLGVLVVTVYYQVYQR